MVCQEDPECRFLAEWIKSSLVMWQKKIALRLGILGLWAIGLYWSWVCYATIAIAPQPELPTSANFQRTNYRANGEWIGRLILPTPAQMLAHGDRDDWVWIEIEHAPVSQQQLVGKTLVLNWQPDALLSADVSQVTTDVRFTPQTIASQQQGNLHPQRLNGRNQVGALQSLAGARAQDDVVVRLSGVEVGVDANSLQIDREPLQITGTWVGLVQLLGVAPSPTPLPAACPGTSTCPSEYVRVRHYDPHSHAFNGQIETVRIPQVPATKSGLFPSTIRDLTRSSAGDRGWYIYGNARGGLFTVAAIQPRALFQLAPVPNLVGRDRQLDYLNRQHWENTPAKKGRIERTAFNRQPEKLGDRALTIHTFGGIGGKTGDTLRIWHTVTGHFAYGIATVVRDEFTGELRWAIDYNQVYAHNPDGIIAGKQDWATYMGNLQRGWLGTRPVADVLISYPPVTEDYDFGGLKLSPLTELQLQLQIFAARYRTGDGTGNASVTPATSCVQDANQALYITIRRLQQQVRSQPQIQAWLDTHPQHPQTLRFSQLRSLGTELATDLAPLGIVRQDWQQNAAKLMGTNQQRGFASSSDPLLGLTSWRTMLPRGAQDSMTKIFSQRGAAIWLLNTYQVGGWNPDIFPIAPTVLFGQLPLLSTLVIRLWAGIVTLPTVNGWLLTLGLIFAYASLALPLGFKSGFLTFDRQLLSSKRSPLANFRLLIHLFFLPALSEEIGFRLLLIPHPIETAVSSDIYFWLVISLGLFIIYHPVNALTFYPSGDPTFLDWRFLTLTAMLGIVCSIAYLGTGSIWTAVTIHWVVVVCWLQFCGGDRLV